MIRRVESTVIKGPQATLLRSNCALVTTSRGGILVGLPPEIVKTILAKKLPIPQYIVLTERFIEGTKVSVEPEFPSYLSLFIGKQKPTFIGSRGSIERLQAILHETLLGGPDLPEYLRKINAFFAVKDPATGRVLTVQELVNFKVFENGRVRIDDNLVIKLHGGRVRVMDRGVMVGEVDPTLLTETLQPLAPAAAFDAPEFGVTFLGTGSGFVPGKKTTSFVLWTDAGGVFVDPLASPNENLINAGIAPSDIKYIFLTHLHADHDSGLITKILNGQRVNIITSRVIYESLLRKLMAITGRDMRGYINFLPVEPGEVISLGKTSLRVGLALHSIPTINLVAEHQGKKIAYTADTLYVPETIRSLVEQGVITPDHAEELLSFGVGADLLIHETGIPPLHTPVSEIARKIGQAKRIVVVHTGPIADLPSGLEIGREGGTLPLVVAATDMREEILKTLRANFLFASQPEAMLSMLASTIQPVPFKAGDVIVQKGEAGDVMYLVERGMVEVKDGSRTVARMMPGDLFGEVAPFLNVARTASVVGLTDGTLLPINRQQLELCLTSDDFRSSLERLVSSRSIVSQLSIAREMSSSSIAKVARRCVPVTLPQGAKIIAEGTPGRNFWVLANGEVEVSIGGEVITRLESVAAFGEIALLQGGNATADVTVTSPTATVLMMRGEDFTQLCEEVPQLRFLLTQMGEERREESFDRVAHLTAESEAASSPRRAIGNIETTLKLVQQGRLSPLDVLHAAELWLNKVRREVFDPCIPFGARPGSGVAAHDLPFGVFNDGSVTIFSEALVPPWLRAYMGEGNERRMYVHPQHYFHLAGQLKERFAQSRRARPSSSFRTLYFPDEPAAIKTHFPYYLGRYERRLSPSSAEHSDLLSRLIEEICRRDGASLPTDFAFFPEYGVAQPGDEGIPGGFGNVYREIVPHPAAGEPLLIYPFFALYTPDIRFLEHKEPPLLVQLINLNKRTGEHGVDYFVDQIWRNVISSWAHFVFERGVMLEPHGQNLLVGIDYSGRFKKFIHRDFQSCMVDVNLLRQNGLFSGFKKHHLGLETSAEESFSLVYDHFFGHYMMDPIVDVLSRAYSVDKQEIIGRLREVAREVFGANLSRFPAKTLRHKRDVGRFAGNVVSLEVGGRPRYR